MSIIDAVIRKCCCAPGDPKATCCLLDSQYWRNAFYLRVANLGWTERQCSSDDPAIDCSVASKCCFVHAATVQIDGAVFRQPFAASGPDYIPCGSFEDPICCPDQVPDGSAPGGCDCPSPWVVPNNPARPFGSAINSTYRSVCCEDALDYMKVRYTGSLQIEEVAGSCDQTIDGVPVAFPATVEDFSLAGKAAIVCMDDLTAADLFPVPGSLTVVTDPCLDGSIFAPSPFPLHALIIEPTESLSIDNFLQYGQGPLTWAPPTLVYIARLTRETSPQAAGWTLMYASVPLVSTVNQGGSNVMPFCGNLFDPNNDPCWQPGYYRGPCPADLGTFTPLDPVGPAESGCDPSNEDNCIGCYDLTLDQGTLQISTVPFQD